MGQEEKKSKIKNKPLVAVLGVLVGVIVVLAVAVVVVGINNMNRGDGGCLSIVDEYEMRECLARMYEEGNESTESVYSDAIDEALRQENYKLFNDLVFDRADNLALDEECEGALALVDNEERIEQLPAIERASYYEYAQGVADECGNSEKREYYSQKWFELYREELQYDEEYNDEPEGIEEEVNEE